MKLWEKTKKLFTRKGKRVKKVKKEISVEMTESEKLIQNNWGLKFIHDEPARAGEKRAHVLEAKKMEHLSKIPQMNNPNSRQVRRQLERCEFKNLRSEIKMMQNKQKKRDRELLQS